MRMIRRTRFLVCLLAVMVAVATMSFAWWRVPRIPGGLSERTETFGDRTVTFLVYRLPYYLYDYDFAADPERPRTVKEWREELGADVVFNGSYFMENGMPSGFWKLGKGKSALAWPTKEEQADPYGYTFALTMTTGLMRMAYLPEDPQDEPVNSTLLSFPTLVADGQPMVAEDSGQLARRTAIAKDAGDRDYLIVTKNGVLSLYELARWLAEQPEKFVIAGNLDGGPSSGVSIENGEEDIDVLSAPVPNVIAGRVLGQNP